MNKLTPLPHGALESNSLDDLLALARTRYNVEFETFSVGEISLEILQISNMHTVLDQLLARNALNHALKDLPLWAKVWPAGIVLGHYLRHKAAPETSLLEVGAGCGVSGLLAAKHGFGKVTISDIHEDALLFCRINALKNDLTDKVRVMRVNISLSNLPEKFDMIVGSEILYLDDLHRPLARFFERHLKPQGEGILMKDFRRKDKTFRKHAEQFFNIEERLIGMKNKDSANAEEKHLFSMLTLQHKQNS